MKILIKASNVQRIDDCFQNPKTWPEGFKLSESYTGWLAMAIAAWHLDQRLSKIMRWEDMIGAEFVWVPTTDSNLWERQPSHGKPNVIAKPCVKMRRHRRNWAMIGATVRYSFKGDKPPQTIYLGPRHETAVGIFMRRNSHVSFFNDIP